MNCGGRWWYRWIAFQPPSTADSWHVQNAPKGIKGMGALSNSNGGAVLTYNMRVVADDIGPLKMQQISTNITGWWVV